MERAVYSGSFFFRRFCISYYGEEVSSVVERRYNQRRHRFESDTDSLTFGDDANRLYFLKGEEQT